MQQPGGKPPKPPRKTFRAKGETFALELRREGPTLGFYVLDAESPTPRYLGQVQLGTNDVSAVKLFASNRNGAEPLDVVLRGLTVHAERITGLGTEVRTVFGTLVHGDPTAIEDGKLVIGGAPKADPNAAKPGPEPPKTGGAPTPAGPVPTSPPAAGPAAPAPPAVAVVAAPPPRSRPSPCRGRESRQRRREGRGRQAKAAADEPGRQADTPAQGRAEGANPARRGGRHHVREGPDPLRPLRRPAEPRFHKCPRRRRQR